MRRFLISLIVAAVSFSLSACKADNASKESSQLDSAPIAEASAPTPRAPVASAAPDARPLVVCFGDSLTAGYGADAGASYPDFLQKDLDADGFHYRVLNEGISGNTTKDGVDRLAKVEALHPDLVVLEFGGNDGLRGFKVDVTRANLATMISGLQRAGAKVVLAGITLPPDYGPDYVSSFTASYPVLGKKYKLPVLPFLLQNVYGVEGLMQADNVHATDKGNEVVARNVLPLVEASLKK